MSSKVLKRAAHARDGVAAWQPRGGLPRPSAAAAPSASPAPESQLQDAYQRGYRDGEVAGNAAIQPVVERLAHSIDALAGLAGRTRREAEGDLLKLAVAIARRILHRELAVDPDAVSGLIAVALEKLRAQEIHRVRLHPGLEAPVRRALEASASGRNVVVLTDTGRQPGDVVFETERGRLDASVETQLDEIGRGLADRLRGRA